MKIPKKIRILGLTYDVKFTKNIQKDVRKFLNKGDKDVDLAGFCSVNSLIILISTKTARQNYVSVFIHEILEAIDSHLSLNLKHDNIERLEAALYQVLVENKLLK